MAAASWRPLTAFTSLLYSICNARAARLLLASCKRGSSSSSSSNATRRSASLAPADLSHRPCIPPCAAGSRTPRSCAPAQACHQQTVPALQSMATAPVCAHMSALIVISLVQQKSCSATPSALTSLKAELSLRQVAVAQRIAAPSVPTNRSACAEHMGGALQHCADHPLYACLSIMPVPCLSKGSSPCSAPCTVDPQSSAACSSCRPRTLAPPY